LFIGVGEKLKYMLPFLTQLSLEDAMHEYTELATNLFEGLENLSNLREEDIQVGVSEKEEIYREDKLTLYHFKPLVEKPFEIPVLLVYALVIRPYMVDLQDGRSLVQNLLKLGLDLYLIDWGYPTRADRWLTLDDYINGYIDNCVDVVRDRHNLDKINLLGICQGGTFSSCYSALHPNKVKNLVTTVTPIDFHVSGGLLNLWGGSSIGSQALDVDLMVKAQGNMPGEFLNFEFLMLKPWQLAIDKYLDFPQVMGDQKKLLNFMRMEKWIFDSPDQAGEAYRQFMKDFYQDNKLIKGELKIGDHLVDLGNIRMPVLNIYAEKDHLVPPESSIALEKYIGSEDYTAKSFPVGHIGIYVSGKVQRDLPPTIADWLKARRLDNVFA
jgi:polyhydroxyalkanoate synthase